MTLGVFDRQRKTYIKIPINEPVEVLIFTGNIVRNDCRPPLHAHVVVGKADGTAHGGHFPWWGCVADAENHVSEMAILSAVAMISHSPFVFPSLGPTAILFFFHPMPASASPRHACSGTLSASYAAMDH
jgi:hypothetical protein